MPRAFSILLLTASAATTGAVSAGELSFNRDVRPILSEYCYSCHGFDKAGRKADLRLDQAESAFAERDGAHAIVPGKPDQSDAVARMLTTDEEELMPPPKAKKPMKPEQIAVIREWIAQGAKYEGHWAFSTAQKPALPAGAAEENAIDAFIQTRLSREHLATAKEADKPTLIRRVTYDLIGLPPTLQEVDAFLTDTQPGAYERLVDRLLASPRFGEKMAVQWLDLSRYADTHGYHLDSGREQWPWRDWVVKAFNENLRFDEFVRWQLAGDLLPNATREQKLATGFVRNNMINFEGGAIAEEYLNAYVVDRVNTFGTVFLGLSLNCSQCHDHKYDPITQKEYYQLYAYFNAVPEKGLDGSQGNASPLLELPTVEQEKQTATLQEQIATAKKAVADATKSADAAQAEWEAVPGEKIPDNIQKALEVPAAQSTDAQKTELQKYHREKFYAPLRIANEKLEALNKDLAALRKSVASAMVMEQMAKPRTTNLRVRGDYATLGEVVQPGIPAALGKLPPDAPADRRALADWLVDPKNPLLSRVTVNRWWRTFFGTGLVKTVNDFGLQGEWPSHPELLEWLATEYSGKGWDTKALIRLMVTSAAYRQGAASTPQLRERDPENRLLARGPRFRLSAEEIRDTALFVSGLMDNRIGGPSVYPYQPAGIWEELSSRGDSKKWSAQFFEQSHGADLYRRSLYTFIKRTCPPPQMQTFDAPDREICTAQRDRTNTPLQALVTLNDPTYVESSRVLAEKLAARTDSPESRIADAFRLATARIPTAKETAVLKDLFEKQRARYTAQPEAAIALLKTGEFPRNEKLNASEVAAWAIVVSTILNLDETLTRG